MTPALFLETQITKYEFENIQNLCLTNKPIINFSKTLQLIFKNHQDTLL